MSARQAVPIILSLFFIFHVILWASYRYAQKEALIAAGKSASQIAGTVSRYEEFYRARVEKVAAPLAAFFSFLGPHPSDPIPSTALSLERLRGNYYPGPWFLTIRMLDEQGHYSVRHFELEDDGIRESTVGSAPPERLAALEALLWAVGYRPGWHSTRIPGADAGILMNYSVPLCYPESGFRHAPVQVPDLGTRSSKHNIFGALTISISVSEFEAGLRRALPLDGALLFLVAPDDTWTLPSLFEERYGVMDDETEASLAELKRTMHRRATGRSGLFIQGKNYVAVYMPILAKGAMLGLLLPRNDLLGDVNEMTVNILVLSSLFLVGAYALVRQSVLKMLKPLERLSAMARHLARGEVDFSCLPERRPPLSGQGEPERLLRVSEDLRVTLRERMRSLALFAVTRSHFADEMCLARRILDDLLPSRLPELESLELAARSVNEGTVGGTLYDCFALDQYRLGLIFCNADIQGLPSVLLMCRVMPLLRELMLTGKETPGRSLGKVNAIVYTHRGGRIHGIAEESSFLNVSAGVLDTRDGRFVWSGVGQFPPYIIKNNPRGPDPLRFFFWRPGGLRSLPLGMNRHAAFPENEMILAPDDMLLFCDDNLLKGRDHQGEPFGEERLRAVISMHGSGNEHLLRAISESWRAHTDGLPQGDHILLSMTWHGRTHQSKEHERRSGRKEKKKG